ncbi:MAG: septal ring lytic transglycosylase RlpA family protein [Flavobacteriaceae bacterium]|nr:septal ring lytic transglycosylase RlpA family protein [Flavobacteriaceae bacterium]
MKVLQYIFAALLIFTLSSFGGENVDKEKVKKQVPTIETVEAVIDTLDTANDSIVAAEEEEVFELVDGETKASYYHDKFTGRKTASGAIFDNSKYTAAHKTLPFGTKIRVTNLKNKRSVVLTVTDRGPFTKGRTVDLSKRAFFDLTDNQGRGVLDVKIEKLTESEN